MADKGITCPACEGAKTKVYDSRPGKDFVIRRRACLDCKTRFGTEERTTHIIRMMDSFTSTKGRPETFPSDGHIRALRAIASGASNRNQVALMTGISRQQVGRLVDRLVKAKLVDNIFGAYLEDAHPLTTVVQITSDGAAFLARSSRPIKCDD